MATKTLEHLPEENGRTIPYHRDVSNASTTAISHATVKAAAGKEGSARRKLTRLTLCPRPLQQTPAPPLASLPLRPPAASLLMPLAPPLRAPEAGPAPGASAQCWRPAGSRGRWRSQTPQGSSQTAGCGRGERVGDRHNLREVDRRVPGS